MGPSPRKGGGGVGNLQSKTLPRMAPACPKIGPNDPQRGRPPRYTSVPEKKIVLGLEGVIAPRPRVQKGSTLSWRACQSTANLL